MGKEINTPSSDIYLKNRSRISYEFTQNPFLEITSLEKIPRADGSFLITDFVTKINHQHQEYNIVSPAYFKDIYIVFKKENEEKYIPIVDKKILCEIAKKIDKKLKEPKPFFSFLQKSSRYNLDEF